MRELTLSFNEALSSEDVERLKRTLLKAMTSGVRRVRIVVRGDGSLKYMEVLRPVLLDNQVLTITIYEAKD